MNAYVYRCAHFTLSEPEVRIDGAHYTSDVNTHIAISSIDNPFRDERICKIREYIGKVSRMVIKFYNTVIRCFLCQYHLIVSINVMRTSIRPSIEVKICVYKISIIDNSCPTKFVCVNPPPHKQILSRQATQYATLEMFIFHGKSLRS